MKRDYKLWRELDVGSQEECLFLNMGDVGSYFKERNDTVP